MKDTPYSSFERTLLWRELDIAITELQQNDDLELTTAPEYVVGFLCQRLVTLKLASEAALTKEL